MQSPTEERPGFLIVLEGVDGGGKTTLATGLAEALERSGHVVVRTREPTGGPIGQQIRELARTGRSAVTAEEEFDLFHQDRKQHVREVVNPAIQRGEIVIQDRSYFSSVAYQGERGLDPETLQKKSESIAPKPDLLLVVDIPAEVAVERIRASRGEPADDFEKLESLRRIRRTFLGFPDSVIIDGREPAHTILRQTLELVRNQLQHKS